jgi:hypothetical protein
VLGDQLAGQHGRQQRPGEQAERRLLEDDRELDQPGPVAAGRLRQVNGVQPLVDERLPGRLEPAGAELVERGPGRRDGGVPGGEAADARS